MTVKIKNCGLKTSDAIVAAEMTGASFVGFVHHAPSPRHLPLEAIATLSKQTPESLKQVVVLVKPDDALIDAILKQIKPHFLQVHGVADPKRLADIRNRAPLITAIGVSGKDDLAPASSCESVSDHLLFDGKTSGSGEVFDWSVLSGLALKKPWFLAGGLNAGNVAAALAITHAPMVDISSGIESAPGIKSLEKIAAFNKAVLNAAHG